MNALDTIRAFITDNLFMGDDFLVVRAQDQTGNFFCVKISPTTNKKQERGLLFEKYTCDDIRTLNDFVEKRQEFDAELDFLKSLNIIVVQFQRDGLKPIVIFGEWENPQEESEENEETNDEDKDETEQEELQENNDDEDKDEKEQEEEDEETD
jgi:hypothetical protein